MINNILPHKQWTTSLLKIALALIFQFRFSIKQSLFLVGIQKTCTGVIRTNLIMYYVLHYYYFIVIIRLSHLIIIAHCEIPTHKNTYIIIVICILLFHQ